MRQLVLVSLFLLLCCGYFIPSEGLASTRPTGCNVETAKWAQAYLRQFRVYCYPSELNFGHVNPPFAKRGPEPLWTVEV
ncbi:unnamed protein product [Echinostoma caproni]|uniref:Thyroglobulin n=1 Tax=Echinostoma caproni TaxID=27848 RepID=A0A183ABX5_9TREM|nr:unnamed protein product [Echinostoma caproni]